jgi:glycosyltransferase involved in cell wall biosynthesis
MEQLLAALASTGELELMTVSWSPLGLDLPNVRELIPAIRPPLTGIRATLWKLWFDQWLSFRSVAPSEGVVVHGMDGFLPYSLRRRDCAIATVHDLGWQVHPELYDRKLRVMYGALFPWVVRRANRFIAVSRYTADDLIRRAGVPSSRIDVVYHGLDPVFAKPVPAIGPERSQQPYLLAVGGVSPRKNTRRLIQAFTGWRSRGGHRSDYQLWITGTSLDPEFSRSGAPLPEGVKLLGYVEKGALPGLYAGARGFLYPGIYEGFGLPIIEAMACGTPVVTSQTGAAPEIAGGAAILVDPFDLASMEAGLEQVTTSDEVSRLRELGLVRARSFEWGVAAAATIDAYRRC